ncbi:hypothetical protein [Homoserinibacter sp. GY 40078]|uniref:hypothetical protein n=1 Tax=Homoserinibacter sp. GY 40078 TaxID=2603275 RepID=UPI0011CCCEED|nr:hypothetical protein [Homoserinibacter sp. GY 40078]TXK19122.1 hypothetical protein FVQ89_04155 [Homoserinibacter sp. GY 40078]
MSAYGIGADTAMAAPKGKQRGVPVKKSNVPETIVKWIPGEAITFYAGIIGIGAAQEALTGDETAKELLERIDAGSLPWFVAGASVAVALVIVGALTTGSRKPGTRPSIWALIVRSVLTLLAFALWTSALPGSWTYGLHFIRDMGAAYALLLVPLGLVFAAAAEAITRSVKL